LENRERPTIASLPSQQFSTGWVKLIKGRSVKAKVFGIHTIELHPGVKGEDFEKFYLEEFSPQLPTLEGWTTHLLKGERGIGTGRYLVMFEIESVAARDRYYPSPDQPSAKAQGTLESHMALWGKVGTFATSSHTD